MEEEHRHLSLVLLALRVTNVPPGLCQLRPGPIELRDYFVEFAIPLVWVSHPDDAKHSSAASPVEESQFVHDLFQSLPANIPCLGWWDHGLAGEEGCGENGPYSGNDIASQHGKFQVCSAFDGFARGVGNLSVHSGTSATFHQKTVAPPPLADKVYYAYTRTDGDGRNFWRQVYRDLWDQPAHGKVPVGWQLGPTASDLIPDIIDYFYKHALPSDVFINALTGVGYIREAVYLERLPKSEQEAAWNAVHGDVRALLQATGPFASDHVRGVRSHAAGDAGTLHEVARHPGDLPQLPSF